MLLLLLLCSNLLCANRCKLFLLLLFQLLQKLRLIMAVTVLFNLLAGQSLRSMHRLLFLSL